METPQCWGAPGFGIWSSFLFFTVTSLVPSSGLIVLNATAMASTLKYKTKVAGPDHCLILQTWISNHLSAIASSVQFRHSVVSDFFRPHGLQHARLPLPAPRACSNSCLLSWWWHSTISSSVVPFSSCLQSSPASGSFLMNRFFTSGSQSIGASASASVFLTNIQDWFPLGAIAN